MGSSLVDDSKLDYCKDMLEKAKRLGKKLLLPADTVVAKSFPDPIDDANIAVKTVDSDKIPSEAIIMNVEATTEMATSFVP